MATKSKNPDYWLKELILMKMIKLNFKYFAGRFLEIEAERIAVKKVFSQPQPLSNMIS